MKKRKLIRFKIGIALTPSHALILLLAKSGLSIQQVKHWKYNPVTGWVSIRIK